MGEEKYAYTEPVAETSITGFKTNVQISKYIYNRPNRGDDEIENRVIAKTSY